MSTIVQEHPRAGPQHQQTPALRLDMARGWTNEDIQQTDKRLRIPPRTRIVSAASELFARHGIGAVSVEAITRRAASNKMTLYHHFASKDELVAEYLRECAKDTDAIWARIERTGPPGSSAHLSAWLVEMAH